MKAIKRDKTKKNRAKSNATATLTQELLDEASALIYYDFYNDRSSNAYATTDEWKGIEETIKQAEFEAWMKKTPVGRELMKEAKIDE